MRLAIATLILLLSSYSVSLAQFQHFGGEIQILGQSGKLNHAALAFNYCNQFSSSHGYGFELCLPKLLNRDISSEIPVTEDPRWNINGIWIRRLYPYLGARYRLFLGNYAYLGSVLHFGLLKESLFGDRQWTLDANDNDISAVYFDYRLNSPFLRPAMELGYISSFGSGLFISFNFSGGAQFTLARAQRTPSFPTNFDTNYSLELYHGANGFFRFAIGVGLKK